MKIRFQFIAEKAIAAMVYLTDRLGPTEIVKLTKLMYIAERGHFVQHGYPITGAWQVAMDKGPLPSECLAMLDGKLGAASEAAFRFLKISDNPDRDVASIDSSAAADLDKTERDALDLVIQSFGKTPKWKLVDYTHHFPEYERVYVQGTSSVIPYELLLELYGGESKFHDGRPVISRAMRAHMPCPFPANADADL